jgi:hypothetical protein
MRARWAKEARTSTATYLDGTHGGNACSQQRSRSSIHPSPPRRRHQQGHRPRLGPRRNVLQNDHPLCDHADKVFGGKHWHGAMASSARRGALVVLEGCDRAGKSTQCALLEKALNEAGHKSKLLRFPSIYF